MQNFMKPGTFRRFSGYVPKPMPKETEITPRPPKVDVRPMVMRRRFSTLQSEEFRKFERLQKQMLEDQRRLEEYRKLQEQIRQTSRIMSDRGGSSSGLPLSVTNLLKRRTSFIETITRSYSTSSFDPLSVVEQPKPKKPSIDELRYNISPEDNFQLTLYGIQRVTRAKNGYEDRDPHSAILLTVDGKPFGGSGGEIDLPTDKQQSDEICRQALVEGRTVKGRQINEWANFYPSWAMWDDKRKQEEAAKGKRVEAASITMNIPAQHLPRLKEFIDQLGEDYASGKSMYSATIPPNTCNNHNAKVLEFIRDELGVELDPRMSKWLKAQKEFDQRVTETYGDNPKGKEAVKQITKESVNHLINNVMLDDSDGIPKADVGLGEVASGVFRRHTGLLKDLQVAYLRGEYTRQRGWFPTGAHEATATLTRTMELRQLEEQRKRRSSRSMEEDQPPKKTTPKIDDLDL